MKLLVVDDEPGLRQTLSVILGGEGYEVVTASDGAEALERIATDDPDLVLCDLRMPGMDGMAVLDAHRARGGRGLVIVMSAYLDDDRALDAMRRGAYDVIPKPFRADQVLLIVRKAEERERLRQQVVALRDELEEARGTEIVARSAAMRAVLERARKAARHPTTVLVTGESGTGKELVARLVHRASPRAERPFVAINCAAIPELLLESELFGHALGAFTGAASDRLGLFEEADGGTLLLDEIGELPLGLQVKLLRALQEGEVRRVGDNAARRVDVRVIAATSRDLEAEVAAGRFRADLYYRINVVRLHLPPLRERPEDVAALALHFVGRVNARLGLAVQGITPAAMRVLLEQRWPGNVRELENAVERAMVLAEDGQLDVEQLAGPAAQGAGDPVGVEAPAADDLSVKRQTAALERRLIARALAQTGGNRTRAAQLLDLSPRALLYKIREYGLEG
jgi:two-component system, NtrC family, response regulator AtoC